MTVLKGIRFIFVLLIVGTLMGACTFPVTTNAEWTINFGLSGGEGYVIPLGETVSLSSNGTSSAGSVSRVLFWEDGRLIGSSRNTQSGDSFSARIDWTPTRTGEITLQAAVQRGSTFGYSETITVCVLPFERGPGLHPEIALVRYDGDCTIPERSSTATSGILSMSASASPDNLSYVAIETDYEETLCTHTSPLTFNATVTDAPDDVVLVTVTFEIAPSFGGHINSEYTLILNHIGDEAPSIKLYSMTYDAYIHLRWSLQSPPPLAISGPGEITWTARAFGRDGETLLEDGPHAIPVNPVNCDGTPYEMAASTAEPLPTSTPTLIPIPTPTLIQVTFTPASQLDCPPAHYYSDITHKCYAVAIPTATPKNGGDDNSGPNCSQYTSQNACVAAGCTYNMNKKSCE